MSPLPKLSSDWLSSIDWLSRQPISVASADKCRNFILWTPSVKFPFVIGFLFSVVENRDFDLMYFGYGFGIYTKQE